MALGRIKVWVKEKLFYTDLNAEFNNILNNPGPLITPVTFDLTFTDALYDIGKAGLTRPRDIFNSRDIQVGRSLGIGTTPSGVAGRLTVNENVIVNGVGPHAFGGATDVNTNLRLYGTLTRAMWVSGGASRFDVRLDLSSGVIAATSGTSISGSAGNLYFVGGTSSTDFNNNANTALLLRLTDAGILLTGGATVTTGATIGDSVYPNGKGPRGVSGAGANTWAMVSIDANNVVQLGDNANGAFVAITRGPAVAANVNYKGVFIMDSATAGQIDFYDGVTGARYKLTGTAF